MPTYEYECKKCGYTFEEFQNMSEKPLSKCPKCSGRVARLPGRGAGIIFKGSGFYATDYRSEGYKQRERVEKGGGVEKTGEGEKAKSKDGGHKVGGKASQPTRDRSRRGD